MSDAVNNIDESGDIPDEGVRRPYDSPRLLRLGPLHALILSGNTGCGDAANKLQCNCVGS
jgi:hypothetical protein